MFREPEIVIRSLCRLIPVSEIKGVKLKVSDGSEVPSLTCCVLEESEKNNFCCKWSGSLPVKCKH